MGQIHINKFSITLNFIKWIFLSLALSGSSAILASDFYSVKPYIDISTQGTDETSWLPPIANTTRNNELFFSNIQGEIYRAKDKEVSQLPIINLSQHIESKENVTFTSLTLHPNFHLLDQEGSNVIYTAHIEEFDSSTKRIRLYNDDINQEHTHDAVITEWQLSDINNKTNVHKQREVLRIASPSVDVNINQLSFNPYLKPWSDDFGLLYISFKSDEKLKNSALYSGSILRIKPDQFGLMDYTIPRSNPFIKNPKIQDEIIVLGAQHIQQFTWSKKAKKQLIITHKYNNNQLISVTPRGSNYLLTQPSNIVYKRKAQDSLFSTAYYRGKELSALWNKILFIERIDNEWQLSAKSISNKSDDKQLEIPLNQIDGTNQLTLYITHENEVLLWDKTQAIIYNVLFDSVVENETAEKSSQHESSNTLLYSLLFLLFAVIIFFYIKKQYSQAFLQNKLLLRANLARFKFDIKTNEVAFFKRHETQVNTTISTQNILSSEVYLNNTVINTVTIGSDNEFNAQKDNALRLIFEQEHRDKMVDDKVRQITLKITAVTAEQYTICVYLREGNQRLTKEKYHNVIEQLIDWNWYLSSIINPDNTPERTIKDTKEKQASTVVIPKVAATSAKNSEPLDPKPITQPSAIVATQINKTEESESNNQASRAKVDTKLIEALNKLVILKEQGYLTEEEFSLSKRNLLNSLSGKD